MEVTQQLASSNSIFAFPPVSENRCVCVRECVHASVHARVRACVPACVRACVPACVCVCATINNLESSGVVCTQPRVSFSIHFINLSIICAMLNRLNVAVKRFRAYGNVNQ